MYYWHIAGLESIDMVVRQHLHVNNIDSLSTNTDVRRLIMDQFVQSEPILVHWEEIARDIPARYEPYSIELLKVITGLWVTIRGHSFAKNWTMQFESKSKKGTRKTLKQKQ